MSKLFRRLGLARHLRHPAFRDFCLHESRTRRQLPRQLELLAVHHREGTALDFTDIAQSYLDRILVTARRHSAHYRELLANTPERPIFGSADWAAIPLLDRSTVRTQRKRLRMLPEDCELVQSLTTGGSTGEPLRIDYLGGHDGAHQEFLWRLHGYRSGDLIIAADGTLIPAADRERGIHWAQKGPNDLPYGRIALSSHSFSADTAEAYLDFLAGSQVSFLRGYPSFLAAIAHELASRGRTLPVKGVQLTSEAHLPHQVELIERTLGPCLHQYGHAEAAVFGYSAPGSSIIFCAPTYGLVEILDEDRNHVSPGESGEVVVTGFHNFALPLIRYRTGDRATFAGREGGITRLERIEGRTQDIIYSADGTAHRLTALIFGRHYAAFEAIAAWQLEQCTPGQVLVRIVAGLGYDASHEAEIRHNFKELASIDCRFDHVDKIERTPRGKSPLLIQRVDLR